ncbi:WW domain-containing oxidoreductase-like [Plodia interpunctella]|uniref:WW domain-containing oxidoreductase-like n=1 Tax=Plodia interpunctella TaxID=58824 RepID=UPI00236857BC|nr:WW domain-containing oxidoreductase-like [Plodia interpunctella]
MFLPYFRHSIRPGVVNDLCRRNIVTLAGIKNVVDGYWKAIAEDYVFVNIHGCRAEEIVKDQDLSKKKCLITGANSGIGLEMTRCMTSRGCEVLMACRNPYEATTVVKNVCENPNLLRFYETNLASLSSVKASSDEILKKEKNIDVVFLNAAVFGLPWTLTEDGFETTFQINYLSQYYLLMNIEKILAPDARVVFVSSESHRNINWDAHSTLMPSKELLSIPEDKYTSIRAYNVSKLCGLLSMHYLAYRWMHSQKQVFCAHPGSFVKTRLCRNWWVYEALYTFMKPFSKSISQAASTPLYCAFSPELNGVSGIYFKDCKRCTESDIASDLHLSFRVNDLTHDMLRDRVGAFDDVARASSALYRQQLKEAVEDTVMSNYSGTINS